MWGWICIRLAALLARPSPRRRGRGLQTDAYGLPDGHRPPPGLGPLSPSERFLTQEAARGLHELQLFLADERTV